MVLFLLSSIYINLILIGFVFEIGLSVIVTGIPIIILTLVMATSLAAFERILFRALLRVDVPATVVEPPVSGVDPDSS